MSAQSSDIQAHLLNDRETVRIKTNCESIIVNRDLKDQNMGCSLSRPSSIRSRSQYRTSLWFSVGPYGD